MIDFGVVKNYIYFPKKFERNSDPYVVHVLDKWGTNWRGNVDMEALLRREFAFFEMSRCQPYSDELWARCEMWIEKRTQLDAEFLDLMNGGSHGN
jgi:hypothetical protein